LGKACEDARIETIRLGQGAEGLCKATDLARIDHRHRQGRDQQFGHQGALKPTRGFQDDQTRLHGVQDLDQAAQTGSLILDREGLLGTRDIHIERRLRDSDADPRRLSSHRQTSLDPTLQNRAFSPGNCSGC
jgi:hypothetical protein